MNTLWVLSVALPVLQKAPPEPEDVTQGWLGLAMFLFLVAATVLLWLSFRKQLKKVDFEEEEPPRRTRER